MSAAGIHLIGKMILVKLVPKSRFIDPTIGCDSTVLLVEGSDSQSWLLEGFGLSLGEYAKFGHLSNLWIKA